MYLKNNFKKTQIVIYLYCRYCSSVYVIDTSNFRFSSYFVNSDVKICIKCLTKLRVKFCT